MEVTDSSSGSQHPQLPPGFRFHPTDEELVVHYLKRRAASVPLPVTIIGDIDLYKFDPWELPSKATFGEQEWYFFSPRDRKYPNGARPNRAATSGYWKATGTDKPILTSNGTQKIGVKKALVFYRGKPPKGIKTNWIMHEFRLVETNNNNNISKLPGTNPITKKGSLRLDDWVLCRIYKKNNSSTRSMERDKEDSMEEQLLGDQVKLVDSNYGVFHEHEESYFEGILQSHLGTKIDHMSSSPSQQVKRTLPTDQYWDMTGTSPVKKIFQGDDQQGNFVSLLNQFPNTSFQPNSSTIVGDHQGLVLSQPNYHFSNMNWNL